MTTVTALPATPAPARPGKAATPGAGEDFAALLGALAGVLPTAAAATDAPVLGGTAADLTVIGAPASSATPPPLGLALLTAAAAAAAADGEVAVPAAGSAVPTVPAQPSAPAPGVTAPVGPTGVVPAPAAPTTAGAPLPPALEQAGAALPVTVAAVATDRTAGQQPTVPDPNATAPRLPLPSTGTPEAPTAVPPAGLPEAPEATGPVGTATEVPAEEPAAGLPAAPAAGAPTTAPQLPDTAPVAAVAELRAAGTPAPAVTPAPPAPPPAPVPPTQVVQVLGPILAGPDGAHTISLQLYPEELGAVHIEVSLRNGEVSLVMHTAEAAAKDALRAALPDLRAELEAHGLTAKDVTVETGTGRERPDEQSARRSPNGGARADDGAPAADPAQLPTTDPDAALDVRI